SSAGFIERREEIEKCGTRMMPGVSRIRTEQLTSVKRVQRRQFSDSFVGHGKHRCRPAGNEEDDNEKSRARYGAGGAEEPRANTPRPAESRPRWCRDLEGSPLQGCVRKDCVCRDT